MKKYLITTLLLLLVSMGELCAQKLVIGSKVEGHNELTSLEWIGGTPQKDKTWIIDFFSSANPTAVRFYEEHLPRVSDLVGDEVEIIIVTTRGDDDFFELASNDGDKYHFVIDGNAELFKLLQVKFIPYTVVIDKNGKILWQGNLSDLDHKIIKGTSKT
ncbi:MAG: redoxin family protein [Rikenellaceae bacterium]